MEYFLELGVRYPVRDPPADTGNQNYASSGTLLSHDPGGGLDG